ncbi:hypothetical protein [Dactylosporangium sp. CA-092794]|uniref:hypothetical protein n=1 Tax=Dactylosporangium sp. CA-092794 TaxID=3239929 RepID=UPI003D8C582F
MDRRLGGAGAFDLGSWITRALARPMAAFAGDSPDELVAKVRAPGDTVRDLGISSVIRAVAWLFAGVICLGLGVVAMAVEDAVAGRESDVVGPYAWPPMALCLIAGVLNAGRAGVAWYVSEDRWRRAGGALRWLVTPGNRDVLLAVALILIGVAVANA